jgi:acylphosphatase
VNTVGVKVLVSGVVQGVGFRYFVLRLANSYGLKGTVRNLPDGRVEIVAEGDRNLIESFLQDVKTGHPYAVVRDMQIEWLPFQGKFQRFDISF